MRYKFLYFSSILVLLQSGICAWSCWQSFTVLTAVSTVLGLAAGSCGLCFSGGKHCCRWMLPVALGYCTVILPWVVLRAIPALNAITEDRSQLLLYRGLLLAPVLLYAATFWEAWNAEQ